MRRGITDPETVVMECYEQNTVTAESIMGNTAVIIGKIFVHFVLSPR